MLSETGPVREGNRNAEMSYEQMLGNRYHKKDLLVPKMLLECAGTKEESFLA